MNDKPSSTAGSKKRGSGGDESTQAPPVTDPATTSTTPTSTQPARIGRYRIDKILAEGGFGRVYQAYDEELNRRVAIKVPKPGRISQPNGIEQYLAEAQILARLDHPAVVPVYDIGRTEDGLSCYIVSKIIEGNDLAEQLRKRRLSFAESAELVATVAEALQYAHTRGLVHRDVKPGNILIDSVGKPYVADFGLALTEEDIGTGSRYPGTPAYMSPEQARGEGHLVDGRSDIFSLGVVFYELLTGARPFKARSTQDLLRLISSVEARPPRQRDDRIPKALERICMKALAMKLSDRYSAAADMAEDLRNFLRAPIGSTAAQPGDDLLDWREKPKPVTHLKGSGLRKATSRPPVSIDDSGASIPKARVHRAVAKELKQSTVTMAMLAEALNVEDVGKSLDELADCIAAGLLDLRLKDAIQTIDGIHEALCEHATEDDVRVLESLSSILLPAVLDEVVIHDVQDRITGGRLALVSFPAATTTIAEIIMAGVDGRPTEFRLTGSDTLNLQSALSLPLPPEGGIDGDGRQFRKDFHDHIIMTHVSQEDRVRSLDRETLIGLAADRLRHLASRRHRTYYFIFNMRSDDKRERQRMRALLRDLKVAYPPLVFIRLRTDGSQIRRERRATFPLVDMLTRRADVGSV